MPVLSFGNSGGDCAMHNYCLSNNKYRTAAFMLIADDEVRDHANREKALKLGAQWRDAVYYVILSFLISGAKVIKIFDTAKYFDKIFQIIFCFPLNAPKKALSGLTRSRLPVKGN